MTPEADATAAVNPRWDALLQDMARARDEYAASYGKTAVPEKNGLRAQTRYRVPFHLYYTTEVPIRVEVCLRDESTWTPVSVPLTKHDCIVAMDIDGAGVWDESGATPLEDFCDTERWMRATCQHPVAFARVVTWRDEFCREANKFVERDVKMIDDATTPLPLSLEVVPFEKGGALVGVGPHGSKLLVLEVNADAMRHMAATLSPRADKVTFSMRLICAANPDAPQRAGSLAART